MKTTDEKNNFLQNLLLWREKHIKDKQFVLLISLNS